MQVLEIGYFDKHEGWVESFLIPNDESYLPVAKYKLLEQVKERVEENKGLVKQWQANNHQINMEQAIKSHQRYIDKDNEFIDTIENCDRLKELDGLVSDYGEYIRIEHRELLIRI